MENQHIQPRPRHKRTRYYIDNELVEIYAQTIGAHGLAIYNVLARHANSRTQECFPAYELIMNESGIGKRNTVRKYLKLLEKTGLIYIFRVKGRMSNHYRLLDCRGVSRTQKDIVTQIIKSTTKDSDSYPIRTVGSILRDIQSNINKSDKEISASSEPQRTTVDREPQNFEEQPADDLKEIRAQVYRTLGINRKPNCPLSQIDA